MDNTAPIDVIEDVLDASGILFGLAVIAVALVARTKTDSERARVLCVALGFLFGMLSCLSLGGLMLLGAPRKVFWSALPLFLSAGLVTGGVGAGLVMTHIRSSVWMKERRKARGKTVGGEPRGEQ